MKQLFYRIMVLIQCAACLQVEKQKAVFNELISHITSMCFEKCIPKPGGTLVWPFLVASSPAAALWKRRSIHP